MRLRRRAPRFGQIRTGRLNPTHPVRISCETCVTELATVTKQDKTRSAQATRDEHPSRRESATFVLKRQSRTPIEATIAAEVATKDRSRTPSGRTGRAKSHVPRSGTGKPGCDFHGLSLRPRGGLRHPGATAAASAERRRLQGARRPRQTRRMARARQRWRRIRTDPESRFGEWRTSLSIAPA